MIGERLKQERERLGYTQENFAAAAGAKRRTLVDWEKSVSSPTAVQLAELSKIGVNVNYVVTGLLEPKPSHSYSESQAEKAFHALLRDADSIKAVNIYDKDTYNMLVMMFMRQLRQSADYSEEHDSSADKATKQA